MFSTISHSLLLVITQAAQTTHAWLITSGFDMGVMKAVGEAVKEGQSFNWDKMGMTHSLRCIGIAPWGYVKDNICLVSKSKAVSVHNHYHM